MAKFPALMLWTDAWIADTHHLNRCERGTYMDLLILMWRSPGCRVPNYDDWLGRRMHMRLDEVHAELRPLISEFCQTDGNWITQKRLTAEHERTTRNFSARSVSAKLREENKKKRTLVAHLNHNHIKERDLPSADLGKQPKRKATRLAEDWQPSEADLAFAQTQLTTERITLEADKFRDHWIQSDQSTAVKRNWPAAWRTWCRKAVEYGPRGRSIPETHAKPTIMEAVDNLFERINGPRPRETDPHPLRLVPNRRGK